MPDKHLTREEIAERIFPYNLDQFNHAIYRDQDKKAHIKDVDAIRAELISLLKERDQAVWDAACRAQRYQVYQNLINEDSPMRFNDASVHESNRIPYPPFKKEGE